MIILVILVISLMLLSIVAFNLTESFALGYKPPTRAKDLSYNVANNSMDHMDSSKLTGKTTGTFNFDKNNWNFGGSI